MPKTELRACRICKHDEAEERGLYVKCLRCGTEMHRTLWQDEPEEDRLRAALEEIANVDAPSLGQCFGRCIDIARRALEGGVA